jgi:hypothetical protein
MINVRELGRKAVVSKIESLKVNFTDYPLVVEYANSVVVNTSTQQNPYLKAHIVYQDGLQTSLGTVPTYRMLGTIVLEACVKEGTGTKQANDLLSYFYPELHLTDTMFPVRTLAARFSSKAAKDGWAAEAALIPFWIDAIGF